jgi:hypothetical protein
VWRTVFVGLSRRVATRGSYTEHVGEGTGPSLRFHQVIRTCNSIPCVPALCVLRTCLSLLVGSCVVPGWHRWTCNCGLFFGFAQPLNA